MMHLPYLRKKKRMHLWSWMEGLRKVLFSVILALKEFLNPCMWSLIFWTNSVIWCNTLEVKVIYIYIYIIIWRGDKKPLCLNPVICSFIGFNSWFYAWLVIQHVTNLIEISTWGISWNPCWINHESLIESLRLDKVLGWNWDELFDTENGLAFSERPKLWGVFRRLSRSQRTNKICRSFTLKWNKVSKNSAKL